MTLQQYLRQKGCVSVKCGCETGNCGLCTVHLDGKSVLSCTVLAARCDGRTVVTLEGVQEQAAAFGAFLADEGAEQYGFCSPGFIMDVLVMERELHEPTEDEIKRIWRGICAAAAAIRASCGPSKNIWQQRGSGYELCQHRRSKKGRH